MTDRLFVSIVMPALNEERHITDAIRSITPRDPDFDYEILVLDGGSRDGTARIVEDLARNDARIRLVNNPKRIQAAAVNLAARVADPRATILLRADCHAEYPQDFVATCLKAMTERDCASVVVPMLTVGVGCVQTAIAAAQNSRLGNGGSLHRLAGSSGYVEHGHHAAIDRAAFLAVGGYAEDMKANEDAEFDRRLALSGRRIWLCGEATMKYFPRATIAGLARQYFAYGWGRATTCLRHGIKPRARQMAPVAALLATAFSLAGSLFDARFLLIALAYVAACVIWGVVDAARARNVCVALSGPMAIVMHMAWGSGFLTRLAVQRRPAAAAPSSGTSTS